jgi:hypothetical protein
MSTEREPTLVDFNQVIQEIAERLYSLIEGKLGKSAAWSKAVLDVRSPADESTQIAKFRVTLPNGTSSSARLTGVINSLIRDSWEIKKSAFPDQWYGLKLILTPSGECKTEFNYDQSCFDDPTFFET